MSEQDIMVEVLFTPIYEKDKQIGWLFTPPEGYLIYVPKATAEEEDGFYKEIYIGVDYNPYDFPYKAIIEK